MSKPGRFLMSRFKDKPVDIFTSNENEYIHYSQTDLFSWTVVKGIVRDYDDESGIIVLETIETGKLFFLNEFKIEVFWEPGTNYVDFIGDTIGNKKNLNRDIM